ncbi:MAG TPA: hypothetical protein VFV85_08665 [Conexibacter sp.]|nr:hypothetical protein [Conexibacter sp.]
MVTFVRERLVDVQEQLEREARFALALRSLDVGEGETTRDGRPIGELTAVRAARLPPPVAATLTVDGAAREALGFAFGMHAATWSDLDDLGVAAIVYTRGWSEPLVLVTD